MKLSARNQLTGTVISVNEGAAIANVELDAGGQRHNAGCDGVEAEPGVRRIGDVGTEDDEGRMGDIDDVENAEGDRNARRHGRIEAAEQEPGHYRIKQQI